MVGAYTKILDHLTERGFKTKSHFLYNETSTVLKIKYSIMILYTSWSPQAHIYAMQQKNPYILTRTTSSLAFLEWTPNSHYTYGISLSHMQKLHSIYYDNQGFTQNYQHTHISMDITNFNATTIAPPANIIIAHKKTDAWTSWAPHGQPGWYL